VDLLSSPCSPVEKQASARTASRTNCFCMCHQLRSGISGTVYCGHLTPRRPEFIRPRCICACGCQRHFPPKKAYYGREEVEQRANALDRTSANDRASANDRRLCKTSGTRLEAASETAWYTLCKKRSSVRDPIRAASVAVHSEF
jgi:hypothetical protein